MSVHPKLRRMFRSEGDAAVAASFVRAMVHSGKTEAQAMDLVSWYSRTFGDGSRATLDDVVTAARSHGIGSEEIESAFYGWQGAVSEAGGDPSVIQPLPAPSPADDAARKAQIQAVMRDDFSRYRHDEAMQDELQQILQRESGEARGHEVSLQSATKPPASPNRRSEIENIMKSDRARYFKDTAMQAELRNLIAAEQGGASEPAQTFAPESTGSADAA